MGKVCEEGLVGGLFAAQGVDMEQASVKVEFGADEAVCPMDGDGDASAENRDRTVFASPSDEDDGPLGPGFQIAFPAFGKWPSWWCGLAPGGAGFLGGVAVSGGLTDECVEGREMESIPDLGLPSAVEGLDGGLESRFPWGRENRRDAQREAEADDAAKDVGVTMWSREDGVVVELNIGGSTTSAPAMNEGIENEIGGDRFGGGPGVDEAAMQGNRSENLDAGSPFEGESFDHIEGVEFAGPFGQGRQIPASGRGWSTDAFAAIKGAVAREDSGSPIADKPPHLAFKHMADDMRYYYMEAAIARPDSRVSDLEIGNWLWGETTLGKVLVVIRDWAMETEHPGFKALAPTAMVPTHQRHRTIHG